MLASTIPDWATGAIIQAGQRMDVRGWVPATAGNISVRLPDEADGSAGQQRIAITRSGGHKGFLNRESVMLVDENAVPLTPGKPSAETLLHCQVYRHDPKAGAVLHGHSVAATVLSRVMSGPQIIFQGYEVQKVFEGQTSHEPELVLPIFDNDQDIARLVTQVETRIGGMKMGYVIRGHGVYVWGPDMLTALARLEGLEFLLACEWERWKAQ